MSLSIFRLPRFRNVKSAGFFLEDYVKRYSQSRTLIAPDHLHRGSANLWEKITNRVARFNQQPAKALSTSNIRCSRRNDESIEDSITVIVFYLETTGLRSTAHRIIEVAFHDIDGGENSLFHTLVNPQGRIPNSKVHCITDEMVSRPGVPRMEELIPIMVKYIESRRKAGGRVVLVAHNCRRFAMLFLKNEFGRCNHCIPEEWRFMDSLKLAKDQIDRKVRSRRSASDVLALSQLLQRLTFDLRVTKGDLLTMSFTSGA